MNATRTCLALLSLLLLVGVVLGCVPATSSLGGGPTGPLTLLGSPEEAYVRGISRAFQIDSGIRTTYVRLSGGDALAALRAERSTPRFSVWWGGPADLYIAAQADGLLEPYQPKGAAKMPRQYRDPDGYWTGVYVGVLGLAVNTRVLAEKGLPEPSGWADLIQPHYRQQIAIAHPATSGTAYTAVATILQLQGRDMDQGFAYLSALHQNVLSYSRAGAAPARLAGRGEVATGIAFAHDIIAAIEDGAPDVKLVFPIEGTGYEIGGMALVKNGPNPEAGRRFLDWAMTEHAQELGPLFAAYQIPTNPDAKVLDQTVRLADIKTIDYDFRWAGQQREQILSRFRATLAPDPR
jgi:iron(III) transport system substrate-binding protein